jgi:photosystem II stability/assembly factor-like uncharacterized protein
MQRVSQRSRILMSILLALVLSLGQPSPILAGFYTWTSIGPKGGRIYASAIDPANPNTLYAGMCGGQRVQEHRRGLELERGSWVNAGLTNLRVSALAMDPRNPNTLYAGTGGGGVFRSANGGTSWSPVNNGLNNLFVNALAMDPANPNTLYAGTGGGGVF